MLELFLPPIGCREVKYRVDEQEKILKALKNPECARQNSGDDASNWMKEKVFGPSDKEGEEGNSVTPMSTDTHTCETTIEPGWEKGGVNRKGEPDVEYEADDAHEQVHRTHCRYYPGYQPQYAADLAHNAKTWCDEELAAYTAGLKVLQDWYDKTCR